MDKTFNINQFDNLGPSSSQYEGQLQRLHHNSINTDRIEYTVETAVKNLQESAPPPFIIYGEPQSGKTEMMICLTARLLDESYQFVVLLLNDSVDLLSQNLGRFQSSGIAPSPKNFSEILDPDHQLHGISHVVGRRLPGRRL